MPQLIVCNIAADYALRGQRTVQCSPKNYSQSSSTLLYLIVSFFKSHVSWMFRRRDIGDVLLPTTLKCVVDEGYVLGSI
jgi:hypothetical protein